MSVVRKNAFLEPYKRQLSPKRLIMDRSKDIFVSLKKSLTIGLQKSRYYHLNHFDAYDSLSTVREKKD